MDGWIGSLQWYSAEPDRRQMQPWQFGVSQPACVTKLQVVLCVEEDGYRYAQSAVYAL